MILMYVAAAFLAGLCLGWVMPRSRVRVINPGTENFEVKPLVTPPSVKAFSPVENTVISRKIEYLKTDVSYPENKQRNYNITFQGNELDRIKDAFAQSGREAGIDTYMAIKGADREEAEFVIDFIITLDIGRA